MTVHPCAAFPLYLALGVRNRDLEHWKELKVLFQNVVVLPKGVGVAGVVHLVVEGEVVGCPSPLIAMDVRVHDGTQTYSTPRTSRKYCRRRRRRGDKE